MQTNSLDLSSSRSSSASCSTPDSFIYETKYIVLSFLNQLTQDDQASGTKFSSDNSVRHYAQKWKTRSLPSSPPKQRRKQKKMAKSKRKPFSSDESLHKRSSTASEPSGERNSHSSKDENENVRKKKKVVVGQQSLPLQQNVTPPDSSVSSSLPNRISMYQRSVSEGSNQSYLSDADDELDTSQGSSASSLRGSKTGDFLKTSKHHLHVSRLSTVRSESEGDSELHDASSQNICDSLSPVDVADINFDISPDQIDTHLPGLDWSSPRRPALNGVAESASHENQIVRTQEPKDNSDHNVIIANDDENKVLKEERGYIAQGGGTNKNDKDSEEDLGKEVEEIMHRGRRHLEQDENVGDVVDGRTMSDVSDIGSEEDMGDECGAKGDDDDEEEEEEEEEEQYDPEEEWKLGEAAGGAEEGGRRSRDSFGRAANRSHLFLDLTLSVRPDLRQDEVNSMRETLNKEIQGEILSLESELDEAFRTHRYTSSQNSLFTAPSPSPLTPQSETAEILRRIGDDIARNHLMQPRVEFAISRLFVQQSSTLTYEMFRNMAESIVDDNMPGWRQVALLLMYSQGVAFKMAANGCQGIGNIVDYSVKLLADLTADFIIKQGGWTSLWFNDDYPLAKSGLITTETSESSPEPTSLPFTHQISESIAETTIPPTLEETLTNSNQQLSENIVKETNEELQSNGDIQTDGEQNLNTISTSLERGENSSSSIWESLSNRRNLTKASATLALLSIGIGLALAYIKR